MFSVSEMVDINSHKYQAKNDYVHPQWLLPKIYRLVAINNINVKQGLKEGK